MASSEMTIMEKLEDRKRKEAEAAEEDKRRKKRKVVSHLVTNQLPP